MFTTTIQKINKKETLNEEDLFEKIGRVKKMQEKYFVDYDIPTEDIERPVYEEIIDDIQDEDLFSLYKFSDFEITMNAEIEKFEKEVLS